MLDHGFIHPVPPENIFQFALELREIPIQTLKISIPIMDQKTIDKMGVEIRKNRVNFISFKKNGNQIRANIFTAIAREVKLAKTKKDLKLKYIKGNFDVEDYL